MRARGDTYSPPHRPIAAGVIGDTPRPLFIATVVVAVAAAVVPTVARFAAAIPGAVPPRAASLAPARFRSPLPSQSSPLPPPSPLASLLDRSHFAQVCILARHRCSVATIAVHPRAPTHTHTVTLATPETAIVCSVGHRYTVKGPTNGHKSPNTSPPGLPLFIGGSLGGILLR